MTAKNNRKKWAIVIGVGMALFPVHNQWLTNATAIDGQATLFLPAIGALLWLMGIGMFLAFNYKDITTGPRMLFYPLAVICLAMMIVGIVHLEIATIFAGLCLISTYLAARILGKDMFLPLAICAVIASIGIIAHKIVVPSRATGGYVFEYNYDIATGYILLGVALYSGKWRYLLITTGIVALLLSGSAEAIFAIGVMSLVIVVKEIKRIFNRKVIYAGIVVVVILSVFFISGYGFDTHKLSIWAITGDNTYIPPGRRLEGGSPIIRRFNTIKAELSELKPFGVGYILTDFSRVSMVHNTPLVIVQQLGYPGVMAALAWLLSTIYLIYKCKWEFKYILILVLSLSVFDHYIWTQLAPLWWSIVGVCSANIKEINQAA